MTSNMFEQLEKDIICQTLRDNSHMFSFSLAPALQILDEGAIMNIAWWLSEVEDIVTNKIIADLD